MSVVALSLNSGSLACPQRRFDWISFGSLSSGSQAWNDEGQSLWWSNVVRDLNTVVRCVLLSLQGAHETGGGEGSRMTPEAPTLLHHAHPCPPSVLLFLGHTNGLPWD